MMGWVVDGLVGMEGGVAGMVGEVVGGWWVVWVGWWVGGGHGVCSGG